MFKKELKHVPKFDRQCNIVYRILKLNIINKVWYVWKFYVENTVLKIIFTTFFVFFFSDQTFFIQIGKSFGNPLNFVCFLVHHVNNSYNYSMKKEHLSTFKQSLSSL